METGRNHSNTQATDGILLALGLSPCLSPVMSKVLEWMAKARIKKAVGPWHPGIFGYTNKVSTTEAIATTISEISEVCKMKNVAAIVVFLDLTWAFETCSREVILEQLVKEGA